MNVVNRSKSQEEILNEEIIEGMGWAMVDIKHIECGPWVYPTPSDFDYYKSLLDYNKHPFMER